MKLYEFEGKELFRAAGINTPRGAVAADTESAVAAAERIGYPVVLKVQLMRGGRGKAGGVRFAGDAATVAAEAEALLAMNFSGERVERLLVEEKLDIAAEYYLGITVDPRQSLPLLMVSTAGGVEIEAVAATAPERLARMHLDPLQTYRHHHMLDLLRQTGLSGASLVTVATLTRKLVQAYFANQAITAEINPLIMTTDGRAVAADAKFEIDDSALFRVPAAVGFTRTDTDLDPLEREAKAADIAYVRMDGGDIGLIAGGAGLGMASMDMIAAHQGRPANFLDLGGNATCEKTATALRMVLKTPGVKGVFINLFGGINNCEQMALGIAEVVDALRPQQAIAVKMRGHSQEEGWKILESRQIPIVKFGTTEDAVVLLKQTMQQAKEA